ncbi:hypothetical protein ABIA24_001975 [Sinorhizobium fredii]|uniref:hypothetical protein n=1 Tax=Rhizobium fredii TaxID=380 RepID=UPI003515CE82
MITRQIFEFNDTGRAGDTGPAVFGTIRQIRWNPTTADTGADLQISLLPRQGDTGDGWLIYSKANVLGANFASALGQRAVDAAGVTDTGLYPIYAAGERLRVKVINQAGVSTATTGRLYIWIESNN